MRKGWKQMRILAKDAINHIDEEITLEGWIHNVRLMTDFSFVVLRDRTGQVQGIIEKPDFEVPELKNEMSIRLRGKCVK
jgi:nondiscriminating aspartyl-tRNA synthetase